MKMTSCNYHLINDGFEAIEGKLDNIADAVSTVEIQAKITELDIDLDNLEKQLIINNKYANNYNLIIIFYLINKIKLMKSNTKRTSYNNKLRLLELVGVDIMTEQEQAEAYADIKAELFSASEENGSNSGGE